VKQLHHSHTDCKIFNTQKAVNAQIDVLTNHKISNSTNDKTCRHLPAIMTPYHHHKRMPASNSQNQLVSKTAHATTSTTSCKTIGTALQPTNTASVELVEYEQISTNDITLLTNMPLTAHKVGQKIL